jgi:hypothetical protein
VLAKVGYNRIIGWSDEDVHFAVVVKALSGRSDLALHSVRLRQLLQHRWRAGVAVVPTEHHLNEWSSTALQKPDLQRALSDRFDPVRQQAQRFLVESYVAESVHRLNLSGLMVPSSRVLQLFLRCLQYVPWSAGYTFFHTQLHDVRVAKRWSRKFRQRWNLQWGRDQVPHCVTQGEIKQRASIFLRWIRHVLSDRLCGKPAVVVNMDETFLNNIKPWKRGIVVRGAGGEHAHAGSVRKDPSLGRMALLASVCSHAAVQRLLPQIRMPRAKGGGKVPCEPIRTAYRAAGAPQIAVHGTSGWNTSTTMKFYLKSLMVAARRGAPGHAVMLVMDCCPSHLSVDVLAAAARLGMHVVIIPARLTWLMQPLDTHVFAQLKRKMRIAEYDWKACRTDRRMAEVDRIEMHGEAIREVLVDRDWSQTVARAGLTHTAAPLRGQLAKVVEGLDLAPRAPTEAELATLLNLSVPRAAKLRRLLLPTLAVPRAAGGSAAASSSAAPAAAPGTAVPDTSIPRPVQILSLRRLPSRPAVGEAGQNVWLPAVAQRPQTRSMTAAAAVPASTPAAPKAAAPCASQGRR